MGRGILVAALSSGALIVSLAAAAPAFAAAAGAGKTTIVREAAPAGPLQNEGRWFTDASGRVVILHGVNMVYKRPPYLPRAIGFGPDDARFLARNGFNTVRLGMIYGAVEPEPGRYDRGYIQGSRRTERRLSRHGIFTMVDFHQDLYNERFSGEGWPAWATLDDGFPAEPLSGFPLSYVTSPGLNRAFDNFWANAAGPGGVGLQDRYAAAWARVARSFRRDDAVLGYDLMNEPWPGSAAPTCFSTAGCPAFDRSKLAPMLRRTIEAIRAVERRHIIFNEPHVLFNFDSDTSLPDLGPDQGFSFHVYCLTGVVQGAPAGCETAEEMVFDNADRYSRRSGDSLILSEFGATADIATLERVAGYADEHMVSWQEWHYCGCDDPTTQGPGDVQAIVKDPSLPPRGSNVFKDKLRALARPYPQAVAGTPESYSFDPESRRFELVYSTRAADGTGSFPKGETLVVLPRIQYPGGYETTVEGGRIAARRGRSLVLRPARNSTRVELIVTPRAPGMTREGKPEPDFAGGVERLSPPLRERMTGSSWREGCPVGLGRLRLVRALHWDFRGQPVRGELVVHERYAHDVLDVLRRLYAQRFPIRRMELVDRYGADDHRSMAHDNTSAFNCRYVNGTTRWSMHAYGKAIDINPRENPYVDGDFVSPPEGQPYADRRPRRAGMIFRRGPVVRAFDRIVGWEWAGRPGGEGGYRDYQHLSADGT